MKDNENRYNNYYKQSDSQNKTVLIVILSFIAVILIAVCFIFIKKKNSSKNDPRAKFAMNKMASAVKSTVAENAVLKSFVSTNGEVETQKSIDVFPSMGGKIVQMNVALGSSVKKGDIIGYVDPSEPGSYYSNSPITAPISGSILVSPVKIGQKVSMSSVITKIGDIDNLQITAKIPERYVGELKIGQKAEIRLQAYPDEVFEASVIKISPVLDSLSRTKEIILNFDKKYPQVNAGMFANVKLYTVDYAGYPIIQQDSFVNVDDDYFLYVIKPDSTVEKRLVKRGKSVDGMVQVLEGINSGDVVVIEGMLSLYEGAKVNDISGNVKIEEPENMPPKEEKKDIKKDVKKEGKKE